MELTVVLLAGGASSRMGRDKATLPGPSGRPLAEELADVVRQAGLRPVLSRRRPEPPWETPTGPLAVWVDEGGPQHPLAGILAGYRRGARRFLPVDVVGLTPAVVARWAASPSVLEVGGRRCPLACHLPDGLDDTIAALLAAQRPVRSLVEGLPEVPAPMARNVNRPQDVHWPTPLS